MGSGGSVLRAQRKSQTSRCRPWLLAASLQPAWILLLRSLQPLELESAPLIYIYDFKKMLHLPLPVLQLLV